MRTYGEPIDVRTEAPRAGGTGAGAVLHAEAEAVAASRAASAGSGTALLELLELLEPEEPAQGPAPAQFLWRGRLYVVGAVLAHWVELGTWWTAGTRAARPTSAPAPASAPVPAAGPEGRRSVALDVGAVEREVWRVEARAGRSASVGVYDLVRDVPPRPIPGAARWRLARALD